MKKKKSSETVEKRTDKVNEILLNAITPSGIDFTENYANLGDNVGKIYAVTRYPENPEYGWLAALCDLEGTTTCIEWRNTDPRTMIEVFNRKIKEYRSNREVIKEESQRQENDQAIEDLAEMIRRIQLLKEPFGYLNMMVHVQALRNPDLDDRIKKVSGTAAIAGCNLKTLKYRQEPALRAIAPYGIPNPAVSNQGNRNMPISTFFGGFPMADAGIYDDGGYYLGKTRRNRLVLLNMWRRNADRVNSNWIITGVPGVGKSTTLKDLFIKEYAFGTKIIVFDPEQEYQDLARHPYIHGEIINCGGGQQGMLNPLQVRYAPKLSREDYETEEEYRKDMEEGMPYDDEGSGISDLALHIQSLRVFFKAYFGKENYTARKAALLEEALIETYQRFGITWDTDVSALTNQDYPIMSDLWETVKTKAEDPVESERRRALYEELEEDLRSAATGADSYLWNGHTTVNPSSDFICLDAQALLTADENVKNAQFHNVMMWVWSEMSRDRSEKVLVALDEGYLFADPDLYDTFKFIRNMSKRARKYEAGIMFITHAAGDVLEKEVKRLGQSLIDSACYKFLMGSDGKNLQEQVDLFKLSEEEENILAAKERGKGILIAGSTRVELRIDINETMMEMIGKAGGR